MKQFINILEVYFTKLLPSSVDIIKRFRFEINNRVKVGNTDQYLLETLKCKQSPMLTCNLFDPTDSLIKFKAGINLGSFSITCNSLTLASKIALVIPPGPGPTSIAYSFSTLPKKHKKTCFEHEKQKSYGKTNQKQLIFSV